MRPAELRDLSGYAVPGVADERWERWTAGLAAFLSTSRTWGALEMWATARDLSDVLLKQLVAYLAFNGRVDVRAAGVFPLLHAEEPIKATA